MKKLILQSVALAFLAASSLGGAQAALVSPNFSCIDGADPSAGGTVNWSTSTVVAPTLTFDFFDNSVDPDIISKLDCNGNVFSETVVARKSGQGQKDFLKLTLNEGLVAGAVPASGNHIKLSFTQVLGDLINGVQTYDAYWDILSDYLLSDFDGGTIASTNFLGIKLQTTQKFDGIYAFSYDYQQHVLVFSAELPSSDGVLSLTDSPFAVPEPGTLALLGSGLLGAATLRRRRRGW